ILKDREEWIKEADRDQLNEEETNKLLSADVVIKRDRLKQLLGELQSANIMKLEVVSQFDLIERRFDAALNKLESRLESKFYWLQQAVPKLEALLRAGSCANDAPDQFQAWIKQLGQLTSDQQDLPPEQRQQFSQFIDLLFQYSHPPDFDQKLSQLQSDLDACVQSSSIISTVNNADELSHHRISMQQALDKCHALFPLLQRLQADENQHPQLSSWTAHLKVTPKLEQRLIACQRE
ncbi:hypothetical protein Ciccas_014171, partial [Cichlidogyrus casuarinus]